MSSDMKSVPDLKTLWAKVHLLKVYFIIFIIWIIVEHNGKVWRRSAKKPPRLRGEKIRGKKHQQQNRIACMLGDHRRAPGGRDKFSITACGRPGFCAVTSFLGDARGAVKGNSVEQSTK